jgi:hypothetical protein
MSDKDLQRVTECMSDIGQAVSRRRTLPARRQYITQKIKITGQRTLYLSVHDDECPTEIFLRQNVCPLIKSPAEDLSQNTQHNESLAKEEDL